MLIECRCGETYPADEKDAGGSLRCRCGRIVQVPRSHGRAEPATAVARGETREAVSRWLGRVSFGVGFGGTRHNSWFQVRIDHILTGPAWRAKKAVVDPVTGVDHRPAGADQLGRRAEISRSRLPARRAAALHSRRRAACVQPRVDRVVPIEPGPKLELCQKAIACSFRS